MLVSKLGPRYTLHGLNGSFYKFGLDNQEDRLKIGQTPANTTDWGSESKEFWGSISTRLSSGLHLDGAVETEKGCYLEYYESVANALRNGSPLAVTGEHGRDVIAVIEAALLSAQKGCIVWLEEMH